MKQELGSVARSPDSRLGHVGDWIACLVVWCSAAAMCLALVSVLLNPPE